VLTLIRTIIWLLGLQLVCSIVQACAGHEKAIPIPPTLTPGMRIMLNERVDSSLGSGLFHEDYVPTFFPGVKRDPRYVFSETDSICRRYIELNTASNRIASSVTMLWIVESSAMPNPGMDSLFTMVLNTLRHEYRKPFVPRDEGMGLSYVSENIDDHFRIKVSIARTRSRYRMLLTFATTRR